MEKVLRCYFEKKGLVTDEEFLFFNKNLMENIPFIKSIGISNLQETDFVDFFFLCEVDTNVMKKNIFKAFQLFLKSKNITNFIKFNYGYFDELNN